MVGFLKLIMKRLFPFLFFLISLSITAQDRPGVEKNLFSVSFLLPGIEYETRASNNTTVSLRLGTGFGYAAGMSRETAFGVYLNLRGQYRYFYNLEKRLGKEKKISDNSGNYFGLHSAFSSGNPVIGDLETIADFNGQVGPVWGLQRVYNSGFKLNLFLGAGYAWNDRGASGISPIFGFSLGWALN